MAKTITIKSPVKVITSGKAPTTSNLSNGQVAVGVVGGKKVIYANVNGTVGDMLSEVKSSIATNTSSISTLQTSVSAVTSSVSTINGKLGAANGIATLDSDGKVPSSQLPSYVDDVLEFAKQASFPATGEAGKIYVDLATNLTYRWSGSGYTEISKSLALGETSSTAYAGNKGKANADAIAAIRSDKYVKPTGWEIDSTGNNFAQGGVDTEGTASLGDGVNIRCEAGTGTPNVDAAKTTVLTIPNATASTNGMMSASDKSTLDTLATDAVTSITLTVETI